MISNISKGLQAFLSVQQLQVQQLQVVQLNRFSLLFEIIKKQFQNQSNYFSNPTSSSLKLTFSIPESNNFKTGIQIVRFPKQINLMNPSVF
jgi:hypothetical protein